MITTHIRQQKWNYSCQWLSSFTSALCFYLLKCFQCLSLYGTWFHIFGHCCVTLRGMFCLFKKTAMLIMLSGWIRVWEEVASYPWLCTPLYIPYCNLGGSCHIDSCHYPLRTVSLRVSLAALKCDGTTSRSLTRNPQMEINIPQQKENWEMLLFFTEQAGNGSAPLISETLLTPHGPGLWGSAALMKRVYATSF